MFIYSGDTINKKKTWFWTVDGHQGCNRPFGLWYPHRSCLVWPHKGCLGNVGPKMTRFFVVWEWFAQRNVKRSECGDGFNSFFSTLPLPSHIKMIPASFLMGTGVSGFRLINNSPHGFGSKWEWTTNLWLLFPCISTLYTNGPGSEFWDTQWEFEYGHRIGTLGFVRWFWLE